MKPLVQASFCQKINKYTPFNYYLFDFVDNIQMIEADVIIGKHKSEDKVPIMGHPPSTSSDLSLKQFLTAVVEHNQNNDKNKMGIKLDYKTIEAVQQSLIILKGKDVRRNIGNLQF